MTFENKNQYRIVPVMCGVDEKSLDETICKYMRVTKCLSL